MSANTTQDTHATTPVKKDETGTKPTASKEQATKDRDRVFTDSYMRDTFSQPFSAFFFSLAALISVRKEKARGIWEAINSTDNELVKAIDIVYSTTGTYPRFEIIQSAYSYGEEEYTLALMKACLNRLDVSEEFFNGVLNEVRRRRNID
uniref:Uncharacterized protein n=1 Tax=viral metagenome TaxID=1070528 RepID=A0A6C0JV52_9ZZZZ